jgi:SAM-dependent methyltransferase
MFKINAAMPKVKDWFGKMVEILRISGRSEICRPGEAPTTAESAQKNTAVVTDPLGWNYMAAGFRRRIYGNYQHYLQHQKAKLHQVDLSEYHVEFRNQLKHRVEELNVTNPGDTVLCLGARLGTECLAFKDLGCFAVGIDLNPGDQNLHVLHGDFHNLQFPDKSVDHVFTNALDHVFELAQVMQEIRRVLRPSGLFIAEIVRGSGDIDGREPGAFESYWWESLEEVVHSIEGYGFRVDQRRRFSYPWQGDQIVFRCV